MIKALTVIARAFRVLLFQHLTLINLIETYYFHYCFNEQVFTDNNGSSESNVIIINGFKPPDSLF